ncbi:MAG: type II secretion system F family protein [Pseudomonadota bacterium]
MAVYKWEGKTRKGEYQRGELEAPSEEAVKVQLRRQQIVPTAIKVKSKGTGGSRFFKPKVSTRELLIFLRQFSTMIDAGLPLVQCLDILSSQQDNKTFREILLQIKEDVESGSTFADALKKHPKVFDELFINMVAAGEMGGILDTILNRLAAYIEKSVRLKKRVKGAMVYPAVVMCVALIVVMVILIYVIPVFQEMFRSNGGELPKPTQVVVWLSEMAKKYILVFFVGLVGLGIACKKFYATPKGRALVDSLLLRLPLFGTLVRKLAVARFTRTLSTMLSSGVPILDSLEIVAKTAGNKTIEGAVYRTRESISEGRSIAEPLAETQVFPPMVIQMIAVGEATGELDGMLSKIADFYDEEVDNAVSALTAMIEPILMVFLGATVGGMLIAMYLPIFNMAGAVAGG